MAGAGRRWTPSAIPDVTGRTAVVTGPTRGGIGYRVALELARRGAHVVLAGRDPERLDAAAWSIAAAVPASEPGTLVVDLSSLASVRAAADAVVGGSSTAPLDLLVNNAGVMGAAGRTAEGLDLTMTTNHYGPFLLTGLLLPRLVASGDARVVAVSSLFHHGATVASTNLGGDPFSPAGRPPSGLTYAASKLANLLFTRELDRRAREAGLPITATAAHPGYSGTRLFSNGTFGRRGPASIGLDGAMKVLGQSPRRGAWPVLMAATADLPGDSYCGPGWPGELRGAPLLVGRSATARDDEAARALWAASERAVGLVWP